NTNAGEKSVRGKTNNVDFTNYFMYKDIDSTWLQLKLGENLFRYDADDGLDNLEVFVYFHNKFLEVQECY
ncbi:MAG: phage tail family protein, partial [Tissierellia bacterium]|nr:phage tail family protein [Tissierellia bacterium]